MFLLIGPQKYKVIYNNLLFSKYNIYIFEELINLRSYAGNPLIGFLSFVFNKLES